MKRRRARRGRAGATRSYEYVVYPSTRVEGEGVKIDGFGEKGYQAAARFAKSLPQWGAGVYSVSKGRFVSYVGSRGKMIPIGYPR